MIEKLRKSHRKFMVKSWKNYRKITGKSLEKLPKTREKLGKLLENFWKNLLNFGFLQKL